MKKKSFAYVANLRIPNEFGIGLYVVKVAEAASKLGYTCHFLCPDKTQPEYFPFKSPWEYYRIKKNTFKLNKIKVFEFNHLPGWLEFFFKHFRHQIITWGYTFQAIGYLTKHRIQIIETLDRELIALLRFVFWYRPRVIYGIHVGPKTWYERFFDWLMIPRVDLFMCNCQHFKKYYQMKGVSLSKIIVSPNGFSPADYVSLPRMRKLRKQLKFPERKFILGYAGRFETFGVEKGVGEILKVAAKLKKKKMPIAVVAVGGPKELISKYHKLAKELGLNSKEAVIRPHLEPFKVPQYIKAFDIACMLYPKSDHYYDKMSPLKAIEYLAAEKPIIATNLPSITQILNNKRAFLVTPSDGKALEKTVLFIWENPNKAKTRAKAGYKHVQQFTWEKRQKKILARLTSPS